RRLSGLPIDLRRVRHGAAVPAVDLCVLGDRAAGRGAGLQPVLAARLAGAAAAQAAGHAGRAADPAGTPAQGHDAALPPVAPRGLAAARGGVVRDSGLPAARTAG